MGRWGALGWEGTDLGPDALDVLGDPVATASEGVSRDQLHRREGAAWSLTYLLTYLFTYTYLLTYLLTDLLTYLRTCLLTHGRGRSGW